MVVFVKTEKATHRTSVDKKWGKYSDLITELASREGFAAGYSQVSIMACPYKYKQDYEREAWITAHKRGQNAKERDERFAAKAIN